MAKHVDRRTFVATTATALTGALAGCAGASGSEATPADGEVPPSFDGWLNDVGNYDGVVDKTGMDRVTVEVGAQGNGGGFAYGPAAIRIDAGTTVVWEWTGAGGLHNVVARDGSFMSELKRQGAAYERTFDSPGTYKYYCDPHKAMGMKGVVVVE